MVYCRYCGEKNGDGRLNCLKCGKPLSLLPNDYPENLNSTRLNYTNKKEFNKEFRNNYQNDRNEFNQKSIKSRYSFFNPHDDEFDKNKHGTNQVNQSNDLSSSKTNYHHDYNGKNLEKHNKSPVEWDVVIATALLVIILSTILKRVFPAMGLLIALFTGLIYILIATKSKLSLFKSIPLSIFMIFAISAYFSL